MSRTLLIVSASVAALLASQAQAAVYDVTFQGALTQQISVGTQTPFKVGDLLTMTARFTGPDPSGSQSFKLYGLPTTGTSFWRIDGGGLTWRSTDDTLDGLAGPTLTMTNGVVTGLGADLLRTNSATVPYLNSNGSTFRLSGGQFLYGNTSDPGRFAGVWNFAGATVLLNGGPVPEPSAWALMLLGFGGLGSALRRRRARLAA